jgi:uncharacterized membrane-anchored protein
MIRVLLFTLCVAAAALGVAWLSDGTITVEWLGYQVKTTLVGTLASVALAVLFILLGGLLRYLFARWTRRRSPSSPKNR